MNLQTKASEYFASINSMAQRLSMDMQEAFLSHRSHLDQLPSDGQQQLLHDVIVGPHVLLQYTEPVEDNPESPVKYALKMIVDDHCSYRDEHSAPFSFLTASQLDLTSAAQKKPYMKACVPSMNPKPLPKKTISIRMIEKEDMLSANDVNKMDPDHDLRDANRLTSIPKTGLDLLDNW